MNLPMKNWASSSTSSNCEFSRMAGIVLKHRSGNLKQVSSNKYRLVNAAALAAVLCVSSLALASCNKSSSSPKPSASVSSAPASASASAKASSSPTKKPTMVTSLDQIKVSGEDGKAPKVEGAWPLAIAKTESKVLKEGTGEKVDKNATLKVNYVGVNAVSYTHLTLPTKRIV